MNIRVVCGCALATASLSSAMGPAAAAHQRAPLDVRVFARVGAPGHPDPIAVDRYHGTVYVGTLTSFGEMTRGSNDTQDPSRILAYAPDGRLKRSYPIVGQRLDQDHGLTGLAIDASGRLYVNDYNPPRVVVLDHTGAQRDYARFPLDVLPCGQGGTPGQCSGETVNRATFPNNSVFGRDGSLYVTDYHQGLIWRIPPGGGGATVWFADATLASLPFGPNGIKFLRDGSTLLFVQTNTSGPTGRLYSLPVRPDGRPGALELFYETQPFEGPDNIAVAASGNVYVALAGANQLLKLSAAGQELARVPATPAANLMLEIPFDVPADVAFAGDRVLVTNSSFFAHNPASWAILDVFAGEPGLPLNYPALRAASAHGRPDAGPKLRLAVTPRRTRIGRPTRFTFRATSGGEGASTPVVGARISFLGRQLTTDSRGRGRITVLFRRIGRYAASVQKRGFATASTSVRVRRAARSRARG